MSIANEPAYPVTNARDHEYLGLTKREHFAAMAMQGLCAHFGTCGDQDVTETVRRAVMVADALIAEL